MGEGGIPEASFLPEVDSLQAPVSEKESVISLRGVATCINKWTFSFKQEALIQLLPGSHTKAWKHKGTSWDEGGSPGRWEGWERIREGQGQLKFIVCVYKTNKE